MSARTSLNLTRTSLNLSFDTILQCDSLDRQTDGHLDDG